MYQIEINVNFFWKKPIYNLDIKDENSAMDGKH